MQNLLPYLIIVFLIVALGGIIQYSGISSKSININEKIQKVAEPQVIQNIDNKTSLQDKIIVSSPQPDEKISSPLKIIGKAKGSWFFEAQAPVKIVDETGRLVASGVVKTEGDWQTENFVSFSGELTFKLPKFAKGVLILEKDNPSGKPENIEQLIIPIRF